MKKKKIKPLLFTLIVLIYSFVCVFPVYANETVDIIKRYNFPKANMATYVIKPLAWGLAKGLAMVVSEIEKAVFSVNNLMGKFFTSTDVTNVMNKLMPLVLALFILVICYIGYTFMIQPQQKNALVQNLIIGIIVIFGLPFLMNKAYVLTDTAISYISVSGNQSMAEKILTDNVTDVTLYDEQNYPASLSGSKNRGNMDTLNAAEVVRGKGKNNPDVWEKQVVEGSDELEDIYLFKPPIIGEVDMFSNRYYRYNFDWFNIFTTLLVSGFALIMAGIKIARLLYELVIHQAMANVLALIDIQSGQRLKKCLQSIVSTFFTLFGCFFLLQIYILGQAFISSFTFIPKLICMLALAWAVIDGPNLFEQIVGVDAGLQSGLKALYGAKAAASLVTGGARMVGNLGKTAAHMTVGKKGSSGHLEGGMRGMIMGNKKPLSSVDEKKDAYQGGVRGFLNGNMKKPHDANQPNPAAPIRVGGILNKHSNTSQDELQDTTETTDKSKSTPQGDTSPPQDKNQSMSSSEMQTDNADNATNKSKSTPQGDTSPPQDKNQSMSSSEMQTDDKDKSSQTKTDTEKTPPHACVLKVPDKHQKEKSLFNKKQSENNVSPNTSSPSASPSQVQQQTKTTEKQNQNPALSNKKSENSKPVNDPTPQAQAPQQGKSNEPTSFSPSVSSADSTTTNNTANNLNSADNEVTPLSSMSGSTQDYTAPLAITKEGETVSRADISSSENTHSTKSTMPLPSSDISSNSYSTQSSSRKFNWKVDRQGIANIPQNKRVTLSRNKIYKGGTKRDVHNSKKNERRK